MKSKTEKSRAIVAAEHPKIVDALSPDDRLFLIGLMYRSIRWAHFLFCLPVALGGLAFYGAGLIVFVYMWIVDCLIDWYQPDKPGQL